MTKDLTGLKVKNIDIQNIKNIDYLNYTFSDWVVIGGRNQSWKSSLVDSIFGAIMSHKFFWTSPTKIVKEWENKAIITMQLHNKDTEITIERTFKKWTDWNPRWTSKLLAYFWNNPKDWLKQTGLDRLVNILTIDPLRLQNLNIPDQIKEIQGITWLDTTKIDEELRVLEDERLNVGRWKKEQDANYELVTKMWIPDKVGKVDINEVLEVLNKYEAVNIHKAEFERRLSEKERLEKQMEELQKTLDKVIELWWTAYNLYESENDKLEKESWTEEENKTKLQNAQEINQKADLYNNFIEAKKNKKMYADDYEKCDFDVKLKQKERVEFIKTSKMPAYMTIDAKLWVLIDWVEYKQLNTARKLQVAIDLNIISESPLKVIRIEEGWELDINALKTIQEEIVAQWYQIFIERATVDEYDIIIMDEGELIDDDWEIFKRIEAEKLKNIEISNLLKKNA